MGRARGGRRPPRRGRLARAAPLRTYRQGRHTRSTRRYNRNHPRTQSALAPGPAKRTARAPAALQGRPRSPAAGTQDSFDTMAVASTSLSASLLRDDAGTPAWCSLQAPGPLTSASPALQQLACLHREMAAALEQLAANPDATRGEPEALLALQAATGTSLAQSAAYLDAAGGDLAAAVMCWHNDVLRSFLHCYESANPLSPLSPRQAARNAAAEAMRAKAHRAAQLADTLGADIAASYLRTNFCAITKSEKPAADAALAASGGDLVAAVESFIARHALHACCCASARAPDAGGSPAAAAARAAADDASSSLSSDDEAAPPVRACNARANACPPPAASPACMPSRGRRLLLATGLVA